MTKGTRAPVRTAQRQMWMKQMKEIAAQGRRERLNSLMQLNRERGEGSYCCSMSVPIANKIRWLEFSPSLYIRTQWIRISRCQRVHLFTRPTTKSEWDHLRIGQTNRQKKRWVVWVLLIKKKNPVIRLFFSSSSFSPSLVCSLSLSDPLNSNWIFSLSKYGSKSVEWRKEGYLLLSRGDFSTSHWDELIFNNEGETLSPVLPPSSYS